MCHSKFIILDYRAFRPIKARYPFYIIMLNTDHILIGLNKDHYFIVAIDNFSKWV